MATDQERCKKSQTKQSVRPQEWAAPARRKLQRNKGAKKATTAKYVDEVGDVVEEADFDDSDDDEELALKRKRAQEHAAELQRQATEKRQIAVRGLPFSLSADQVKARFQHCGDIVDFAYPLTRSGLPRGLAFITFSTREGVKKALYFNRSEIYGHELSVSAVCPEPKKVTNDDGEDGDDESSDGSSNQDSRPVKAKGKRPVKKSHIKGAAQKTHRRVN